MADILDKDFKTTVLYVLKWNQSFIRGIQRHIGQAEESANWDGTKWDTTETNICIMVIPERGERVFWRNNGWKRVRFEDMNIHIQEAQWTPSKMNSDTETYYNQTFKRDKDKLESKKDMNSHIQQILSKIR